MRLSPFLLILSFVYIAPLRAQGKAPVPIWKSAVESGDISKLQGLTPPLSTADWGQALRSAILRRDATLARAIIGRFSDPTERKTLIEGTDPVGRTSLFLAVATLQNDLALELVKMGADVNAKTLDTVPKDFEYELAGENRQTPLSKAFTTRNEPMVRLLIEREANLNIELGNVQGPAQRALLMQAVATRNRPLLDLILPKIAKTGNRFSALDGSYMANGIWNAAMTGGDLEIVKALHAAGVPLDPINEDPLNQSTSSALLQATAKGQLEIARWLIQNGANVDVTGSQSSSPLKNAISRNDMPMVDLLLASGAKIPQDNGRDYLNLLWTTLEGRATLRPLLVQKLLDNGAHLPEKYAIFEAAIRGDLTALQGLKSNWGQEDASGRTPLHLAAFMNQTEVLKLLLPSYPQTADKLGQTPLFYAVRGNATGAAQLLIENGADVKVADKLGVTVLHLAVAKSPQPPPAKPSTPVRSKTFGAKPLANKPAEVPSVSGPPSMNSIVALLLKKGVDAGAVVSVGDWGRTAKGTTPLHNAAFYGNLPAIEALLRANAPLEALNSVGQTPLDAAARGGQDAAIALLLSKGAKISPDTLSLAATPIYDAQLPLYPDYERGSRVVAIKKLVSLGANPNTAGPNYKPPLIALIPEVRTETEMSPEHSPIEGLDNLSLEAVKSRQRVAIATALLASGANPNVRSVGKFERVYKLSSHYISDTMSMPTALHLAVESGDVLLVQTLLKFKANPKLWDGVGRTPYDVAVRRGETSIYYRDPLLGYERNIGQNSWDKPVPILTPPAVGTEIKTMLEKAGGAVVGPGPLLQGIRNNAIQFVAQTLKAQPTLAGVQSNPDNFNRNFMFSDTPNPADKSILEIFGLSRPQVRPLLSQAGAKPTFEYLRLALIDGDFALADELLKAGVPLTEPKSNFYNPPLIHQAVQRNNVPMLKWLLEHGVPIDQLDRDGRSPLSAAKSNRHAAAATAFLIERGGNEIK